MTYSTYILTIFETEIENSFNTKKELMTYLSNELFVSKEMNSKVVMSFKTDKYGTKDEFNTKYSVNNI